LNTRSSIGSTTVDVTLEHAHEHEAADGRWPRGIAAVIDANAAIVADSALRLGEVLHRLRR